MCIFELVMYQSLIKKSNNVSNASSNTSAISIPSYNQVEAHSMANDPQNIVKVLIAVLNFLLVVTHKSKTLF